MKFDIKKQPRAESLRIECTHEKEYDNGVPIFEVDDDGEVKNRVLDKKVGYFKQYCPECGALMRKDGESRPSCVEECGGFHDDVEISDENRKAAHAFGDE